MTGNAEKSLRARITGYEKPRGAQRKAKKAGGALKYVLFRALEVRAEKVGAIEGRRQERAIVGESAGNYRMIFPGLYFKIF